VPRLTLVRHGRPLLDPALPAARWPLADDAAAEVLALGTVGDPAAAWFSSPEPEALATARLLGPGSIEVVEDLREAERSAVWFEDAGEFGAVVRRGFESPAEPAVTGWEPLARTRTRVVATVRELLAPGRPLVLVGHGTAWTLLVAELTGAEPDLDAWAAMPMPAVADLEVRSGGATLVRTWRG